MLPQSLEEAELAYSKVVKPSKWVDYLETTNGDELSKRRWKLLDDHAHHGTMIFGPPTV